MGFCLHWNLHLDRRHIPAVLEHFCLGVLHSLALRLVVHANEVAVVHTRNTVLGNLDYIRELTGFDAFEFRLREERLGLVLEVLVNAVNDEDIVRKVANIRSARNIIIS